MSKEKWIPCKAKECELHSQFVKNGEGQIGYPEGMRGYCGLCRHFKLLDFSGKKMEELNLRGRW